jgi:S1-C subfamily serine protease
MYFRLATDIMLNNFRLIIILFCVTATLSCDTGIANSRSPTPVAIATSGPTVGSVLDNDLTVSVPNIIASPYLAISDVVDMIKPVVVSLAVTTNTEQCDFFVGCRTVERHGAGTGVIFDESGLIVTNNHVIDGASRIIVSLSDEFTVRAELVGRDPVTDLAVIRIDGNGYSKAEFGSSDELKVGDWVIAVGNALDLLGGPTVTVGIVGAMDRVVTTEGGTLFNMIQTDAAINPGNSGGPLVNLEGEVVGINTARSGNGEGIGFATSTFTVVPVINSIVENGRVIFPWLGVSVDDVTPLTAAQLNLSVKRGVLVLAVTNNGPAAKAGILSNDIIIGVGDYLVENVKQLQEAVRSYGVGYKTTVIIMRDKEDKIVEVSLEEMPRDF